MKNSALSGLYRWGFIAIGFLIPSAFYGAILGVFALIFLCWLAAGDYRQLPLRLKEPRILFGLLLYACVLGGFFFAHNHKEALSTLSTKLGFLLFPLILGTASVVDRKLVERTSLVFIISTCLFLLIALAYAIYDVKVTGIGTISQSGAVYSKFSSYGLARVFFNWHPTYVSMFANLAIALQLRREIGQYPYRRRDVLLTVAVVVFLTGCIFLLNSVISILAWVVLALYFLIRYLIGLRINPLAKLAISLLLAGMGFCLFYFNPFRIQKIETLKSRELKVTDNYDERNVLTMRLAKWDAHWDVIRQHWLFGVTEGDIKEIRKEAYIRKGYHDLARLNYNAHNQYVEAWATWGIFGLLFLLCLLFFPLYKGRHHPYYVPFLIIIAITFCTETVLNRQQGILSFLFFYALLTHPGAEKEEETDVQEGLPNR